MINMAINFNKSSYIIVHENSRCDFSDSSFAVQISKIIVLAIILFSSLVGNTLIIIIVYRRPELRKTINFFIINMAVSDFVFPLIAVPFNIMEIASGSLQWPIYGTVGLTLCRLRWFLQSVSITVSTESLVWIALDRFVAVVFPLRLHLFSSRSRAFAIASTWFVAVLGNAYHFHVFELVKENEQTICSNFYNTNDSYMTYSKIYTALFQIVPLIAMTVLYSAIAVSLRRQNKALGSQSVQQGNQRKRQAIKIAFCVMAAFYFCVLPMISYFIIWEYEISLSCSVSKVLLFFAALMLYLTSTINPIICMTFDSSYCLGLGELFNSCWCKCFASRNSEIGEREGIKLQRINEL